MDGFSIDAGETPHKKSFVLGKEYWFRELYIGLKVAASFDRSESYRKTIDGQIRCITADFKPKGANVAWNGHHINVFIPAWMVPPIYHSLRREYVTFMQSPDEIGVRTLRPGFEDETVARLQLDRPIPLIPCMACALPSGKTPFHSATSPTLQP